jgi:broad specificity phosphatase PhoE
MTPICRATMLGSRRRKNGTAIALAASSLLCKNDSAAAAFSYAAISASINNLHGQNHEHHRRRRHHRLQTNCSMTTSSRSSKDDPSLTTEGKCYKWLKESRPIRIHAKPFHPSDAAKTKAALLANTNNNDKSSKQSSTITTKIVHFQRHGQGLHNQIYQHHVDNVTNGVPIDLSETNPKLNPLVLPNVIDAPLTDKGRDQCSNQRLALMAAAESDGEGYDDGGRGYLNGVELIVVSPLVRALETACITFQDHLPSSSSSSSTTTNNHQHQDEVKWIAHEGIREELGLLLCNQRRPLRETISEFPHVDFSLLQQHQEEHDGYDEDEDIFWKRYCEGRMLDNDYGITMPPRPRRETMEDMSHRAYDFLVDYLLKRPEMEIAVVGHSAWLLAMTSAVLEFDQDQYDNDSNNGDDNEGGGGVKEFGTMFGQAELRSATLTYSQHDNR